MQERIALNHLRQQDFTAYLPEILATDKRQRTQLRPLFPNYLFVSFDVLELGWRTIPSTIGVRRLFSADIEQPIPLPVGFVEELQVHGRPDQPGQPLHGFQENDTVKLLDGPFTNFQGLVRLDDRDRVHVLLRMLGQERLIALRDLKRVVKVHEASTD